MACDSDRTASRSSSEPHLQSALPQGNKLCREVHAQRHLSVATHQLHAKRDDDLALVLWTVQHLATVPTMVQQVATCCAWCMQTCCVVFVDQSIQSGEQELMITRAQWAEMLGWPLDLRAPEVATTKVQAAVVLMRKPCLTR